METQNLRFNRILLIILIILFILSIAAFSYVNWSSERNSMQWWMILLNIPILAIPFTLLYGSIYVLATGWQEHRTLKQISPRREKIIHWAPRIATILIIFFISLFSLDVFEMEATPLELLGGLLIHNIPSILMLVLLIFAWERPAIGFAAFFVFALLFALVFVREGNALPSLLLIVLPILLIALLFYADWRWIK
jgi:hypothetical protein